MSDRMSDMLLMLSQGHTAAAGSGSGSGTDPSSRITATTTAPASTSAAQQQDGTAPAVPPHPATGHTPTPDEHLTQQRTLAAQQHMLRLHLHHQQQLMQQQQQVLLQQHNFQANLQSSSRRAADDTYTHHNSQFPSLQQRAELGSAAPMPPAPQPQDPARAARRQLRQLQQRAILDHQQQILQQMVLQEHAMQQQPQVRQAQQAHQQQDQQAAQQLLQQLLGLVEQQGTQSTQQNATNIQSSAPGAATTGAGTDNNVTMVSMIIDTPNGRTITQIPMSVTMNAATPSNAGNATAAGAAAQQQAFASVVQPLIDSLTPNSASASGPSPVSTSAAASANPVHPSPLRSGFFGRAAESSSPTGGRRTGSPAGVSCTASPISTAASAQPAVAGGSMMGMRGGFFGSQGSGARGGGSADVTPARSHAAGTRGRGSAGVAATAAAEGGAAAGSSQMQEADSPVSSAQVMVSEWGKLLPRKAQFEIVLM